MFELLWWTSFYYNNNNNNWHAVPISRFYITRSDGRQGMINLAELCWRRTKVPGTLLDVQWRRCNIQQHNWVLMEVKLKVKKNSQPGEPGRNVTNYWTCSSMDNLKEQRQDWRTINLPRNGWSMVTLERETKSVIMPVQEQALHIKVIVSNM